MARKYGNWEIQESMTEGGQAHIYLAKRNDGQLGVIKRLKNIRRKERFRKEVECINDDPKGFFPKILDIDLDAEKPYFVMEYFPKGCLREEIIESWGLEQKIKFFLGTMLAVAYANLQGVIHRDLKPDNILVDAELRPKVSDFGICFLGDSGDRETLTEEAAGSFRFMAPELEDGRSDLVGTQSDVYSVGKIAYWLFSGGKIYNRERHREQNFDLSKSVKGHWPHYFNEFLDKATHHDVSERIQTCQDMILAFNNVRKSMTEDARYLDVNIEQKCAFCNLGNYSVKVNALDLAGGGATNVSNFGFNPVGSSQWLILTCDTCGNVQSFRKDYCKNWSWKT